MWRFLEAARRIHGAIDYERLAAPYLLQLQERQQDVVEYLSRQSAPARIDPAWTLATRAV